MSLLMLEFMNSPVIFWMAHSPLPLVLFSMGLIQPMWIYHTMTHPLAPMSTMWQFHSAHLSRLTPSTTMLCHPWEYECRDFFVQVWVTTWFIETLTAVPCLQFIEAVSKYLISIITWAHVSANKLETLYAVGAQNDNFQQLEHHSTVSCVSLQLSWPIKYHCYYYILKVFCNMAENLPMWNCTFIDYVWWLLHMHTRNRKQIKCNLLGTIAILNCMTEW